MLASWRLASLLVNEDGPWAVFSRLRYWAGIRKVPVKTGEQTDILVVGSSSLAQGLTCVWCISVCASVLLSLPLAPVRWLRNVLAISAGAIVAHEGVEWLRSRR